MYLGHVEPQLRGRHGEFRSWNSVAGLVQIPGGHGKDNAARRAEQLHVKLCARRRAVKVACLEVLHHVAGLHGAGLLSKCRMEIVLKK